MIFEYGDSKYVMLREDYPVTYKDGGTQTSHFNGDTVDLKKNGLVANFVC